MGGASDASRLADSGAAVMRLIIAGSRTIAGAEALAAIDSLAPPEVAAVICGGAAGVDAAGRAWAEARGIPVLDFPADWARYGRGAGPIRNAAMVGSADALLQVWDGRSRGSADVRRRAVAAGLPLFEHRIPAQNWVLTSVARSAKLSPSLGNPAGRKGVAMGNRIAWAQYMIADAVAWEPHVESGCDRAASLEFLRRNLERIFKDIWPAASVAVGRSPFATQFSEPLALYVGDNGAKIADPRATWLMAGIAETIIDAGDWLVPAARHSSRSAGSADEVEG